MEATGQIAPQEKSARFDFSLSTISEFPSAIYLAPTPRAPFDLLTRISVAKFPDCQPYGGAFGDPVPHLTVAQQPPAEDLAKAGELIRLSLEPHIPIRCSAKEVSLAIKRAGRWSIAERFAFSA